MGIDDNTDAIFFDPDVFGTDGTFHPAEGGEYLIAGVYSEAHVIAGGSPGVSTSAPVYTIPADTQPRPPQQGDRLTITGRGGFLVTDPQPDGSGLIRLILERA